MSNNDEQVNRGGWLRKHLGAVGNIALALLTLSDVPVCIKWLLSQNVAIWEAIAFGVGIAALITCIGIQIVQWRRIRNLSDQLNTKEQELETLNDSFALAYAAGEQIVQGEADLHNLSLFLRRETQDVRLAKEAIASPGGFSYFCNGICNLVAEIFSTRIGSERVGCCIRLSSPDVDGYVTKGRSSNLSIKRNETSQVVMRNGDLCNSLTSTGEADAVLFIGNVREAAQQGILVADRNMNRFPDEIVSMMVTRLNVYANGRVARREESMWGILYVTSPMEDAFPKEQADLLRIVADMVASSLWSAVLLKKGEGVNDGE